MHSINLLIVDESGSMSGMEGFIKETYHGILTRIQKEIEETPILKQYIEVWTFEGRDISQRIGFTPVTENTSSSNFYYRPGGNTPLFDAMGTSLTHLKRRIMETEEFNDANVNVCILTDGYENSSREYSGAQISSLVHELKQKGWQFAYFGTDHDVEYVAQKLGINHRQSFSKDRSGFRSTSRDISEFTHKSKQDFLKSKGLL